MFFLMWPERFYPKLFLTWGHSIQLIFWKGGGSQLLSTKNIFLSFSSFPLKCKIFPLLKEKSLDLNYLFYQLQNKPLLSSINPQIFFHQNLLIQFFLVPIVSIFILQMNLQHIHKEYWENSV